MSCNQCCFKDRCCLVSIPGPQGPQGPRGETGPQGLQGPAGLIFNTFGSFYNPSPQTINTEIPIVLTNTIVANNISLGANAATIKNTGIYLITYGINFATGAIVGNNISIAINGVPINGTSRQISANAETSSTTILQLIAGSTITIVPVAENLPVSGTGATSAHLSLTRIS